MLLVWVTVSVCGCTADLFPDANDPMTVFESYRQMLERNFSYFNLTAFDRDSLFRLYKAQVTSQTTDGELEQVLADITEMTNDPHTNLFTPTGVYGNTSYFNRFTSNQVPLLDTLFEGPLCRGRIFEFGILKNRPIGYLRVKSFEGSSNYFTVIDTLLLRFVSTKGLIVDVRGNLGGKISNSNMVAQRFARHRVFTCRTRLRNSTSPNGFTPWQDVYIMPPAGNVYTLPLVVLTDRFTFSAAERFVVSAKAFDQTIVMGDTTAGGSGTPTVCELSNGWILRTSNTQTQLPDGSDFQGKGIAPDVTVRLKTHEVAAGYDAVLAKAIELLGN